MRETVGRKGIDDPEDVAELVLETRSQDALRQCRSDIGNRVLRTPKGWAVCSQARGRERQLENLDNRRPISP